MGASANPINCTSSQIMTVTIPVIAVPSNWRTSLENNVYLCRFAYIMLRKWSGNLYVVFQVYSN